MLRVFIHDGVPEGRGLSKCPLSPVRMRSKGKRGESGQGDGGVEDKGGTGGGGAAAGGNVCFPARVCVCVRVCARACVQEW